jgi:hypothetical protein
MRVKWAFELEGERLEGTAAHHQIFVRIFGPEVDDNVLFEAFNLSCVGCTVARVLRDRVTGRPQSYGLVSFR